jgi:hypothetical protein
MIPLSYYTLTNDATILWSGMAERFIKFIPSEEAFWLMEHRPNAFRLLTHIANTARRTPSGPDGLLIGQCHLQHWTKYNFTEREYRTAKEILVKRKHILIIETNRTRSKSTTGSTTGSTLVQLISLTVYDINKELDDDRNDDRTTTERRPNDDKQERRMKKNEKEDHPSIPSKGSRGMTDDFSFQEEMIEVIPGVLLTKPDLEKCLYLKGSLEKVQEAIQFIQDNPKRKNDITDWPNALSRWKVESKSKVRMEDHIHFAEKLCHAFENFGETHGWRCSMYTDREKDQRGVLFESKSSYQEAIFIALADGEFKRKCEETLLSKNMRKNEE